MDGVDEPCAWRSWRRFDGVIRVLCLSVVGGVKEKYCYGNRS